MSRWASSTTRNGKGYRIDSVLAGLQACLARRQTRATSRVMFERKPISGCSAEEFMQWQDRAAAAERKVFPDPDEPEEKTAAKRRVEPSATEVQSARMQGVRDNQEEGAASEASRAVLMQSSPSEGEIKIPESLKKHMDRANARWKARKAAEGHRFASSC